MNQANEAGSKVEADVAMSPPLSLFRREENRDGNTYESCALDIYRSRATYAIDLTPTLLVERSNLEPALSNLYVGLNWMSTGACARSANATARISVAEERSLKGRGKPPSHFTRHGTSAGLKLITDKSSDYRKKLNEYRDAE